MCIYSLPDASNCHVCHVCRFLPWLVAGFCAPYGPLLMGYNQQPSFWGPVVTGVAGTAFNFHDKNSPSHYFPHPSRSYNGLVSSIQEDVNRNGWIWARGEKGQGQGLTAVGWFGDEENMESLVTRLMVNVYGPLRKKKRFHATKVYSSLWFGIFFIFPYIGNNHPNWLAYFSEG